MMGWKKIIPKKNANKVARTCGRVVSPNGVQGDLFEVAMFIALKLVHTTASRQKKPAGEVFRSTQIASP